MIRRILFWFLIIALLFVVLTQLESLKLLAETLAQGKWQWVALATSLEIGYFLLYAATFQYSYYAVEIKMRLRELFPVVLGSYVVDAVVPAGGATGIALYLDDAARRGYSGSRVTAGLLLQTVIDMSAFSLILVGASIYVYNQGELQPYHIVGSTSIFLIAAFLAGVLVLGSWRPNYLQRLFRWIQRVANRVANWFKKDPFLTDAWAEKSAAEFTNASEAIGKNPKRVLVVAVLSISVHILAIAGLQALFIAFYQPVVWSTLIIGYAIGLLVWMTSPIPQSSGVIEGAIAFSFVSLGISWDIAIPVTLAFRGLTFWLPLVFGLVLLRRIKTFEMEESLTGGVEGINIATFLFGGMGLLNLIVATIPQTTKFLFPLTLISPVYISDPWLGIISGIGLCILAMIFAIRRFLRQGWLAALLILTISLFIHIISGPNIAKAIISGATILWLILIRPQFESKSISNRVETGTIQE